MTLWYQTQLEHGKVGQICWIDRRLKRGQVISLVGDKRKWRVAEQWPTPSESPGNRRWNVGGIESEVARDKR